MFDRVFNTPLLSSLVFNLEGVSSNKTSEGEYGLITKVLWATH